MPPKGFVSLQVREETARIIRFAAVLSGSTPERLRRIMEDAPEASPRAGQVIPFQK